MKKQQSGFTLIELIAVIVILGILSAVAVPRFVDLQDAARQSAVEGVAGGVGSASAMNYAAALAENASVGSTTAASTAGGCVVASVDNIMDNELSITDDNSTTPADYELSGDTDYTNDELGETVECTLTDTTDGNATADFTLYYAP